MLLLTLLILSLSLCDVVRRYSLGTINDDQYVHKTTVSIIERSGIVTQGEVNCDVDGVVVDGGGRIYRLSEQVMVTLGESDVEAVNCCIGTIHT